MPDPPANRAAPQFSGCDHTNVHINSVTATLSPGVYCNGTIISGGNFNVTFQPGTILDRGGFSLSGGGTVQGTGVTVYNTARAGFAYKPVTISGGTNGSLSAP